MARNCHGVKGAFVCVGFHESRRCLQTGLGKSSICPRSLGQPTASTWGPVGSEVPIRWQSSALVQVPPGKSRVTQPAV